MMTYELDTGQIALHDRLSGLTADDVLLSINASPADLDRNYTSRQSPVTVLVLKTRSYCRVTGNSPSLNTFKQKSKKYVLTQCK